ncbi:MAG: A/G-specific adenine glycosylase [Alphaproteobacteria bacterium]|nr:A/G-specific adenine glycosylase [Alphaproteobacteria bacterium]
MISIQNQIRIRLLQWYDQNRRVLPWRANAGCAPNPYHVYLSEIMLQQTTVGTVINYFNRFIDRWPRIEDLAADTLDDVLVEWQGLGYYSRARNLYRAAQQMAAMGIPSDPDALQKLPGVGAYTAAAIASIAFDHPIVPVDGNVIRVFSRLFAIQTPLPALKDAVWGVASLFDHLDRAGDFAQSLMDLGSLVCKPRQPLCQNCPLVGICKAFQDDIAADLPRRIQKPPKPERFGIVYCMLDDHGRILLERRPEKGLLGGMMGFPTTPWEDGACPSGELGGQWQTLDEVVRHTFTHFHLTLHIMVGKSDGCPDGIWADLSDLSAYALPTLMKKVANKIKITYKTF